jgi:hypothetical protein
MSSGKLGPVSQLERSDRGGNKYARQPESQTDGSATRERSKGKFFDSAPRRKRPYPSDGNVCQTCASLFKKTGLNAH